ncbi:MAG: hypothetical protein R3211_04680 [Balneolaceae bacterium]|nr:hypothetical protein [Balneolaceae bacterium]
MKRFKKSISVIYLGISTLLLILVLYSGCSTDSNPNCPDPDNPACPPTGIPIDTRLQGLWLAPTCSGEQDSLDITILREDFASSRETTFDCSNSCGGSADLLWDIEWDLEQLEDNLVFIDNPESLNCGEPFTQNRDQEFQISYEMSGDTLFWGGNRRAYFKSQN